MAAAKNEEFRIGVISDTHGLVRPGAVKALHGVARILHAGDIGKPEVLEFLRTIAPVTAVRGNVDGGLWASALPEAEAVEIGGISLYLLHNIQDLDLDPAAAGFHAVIYGHSHMPAVDERNGVLFLNPGSAGPRRFRLPVSLALLRVREEKLLPQLITLE